ncbi:MAG: shikimate dehydrogenase [Armatimonadetes bacterium]|nr:shikimate dehydrogenase [Armatimonadota bacterium]
MKESKVVALFGHPVGHSRSAEIQSAFFAALGLDWEYRVIDVPPDALKAAINDLRTNGWVGANITIPHKTEALALADDSTEAAGLIGAANALFWKGGKLIADNTDMAGFLAALDATGAARSPAVILGSGGSARAVHAALGGEAMVISRSACDWSILARKWGSPEAIDAIGRARLLVNCTPAGMSPNKNEMPEIPIEVLSADCFVFDLVYNPLETKLLKNARERGLRCSNGWSMLVWQAAFSCERWAGRKVPTQAVRILIDG